MLQPSAPLLAAACLLVGLAHTAQAGPAAVSAPRSIILTGEAGESPVISLALGSFTLLVLDAPIVRESIELEGRARFAVVDVGDRSVTLAPAVPLGPGERLALRVTYREGLPATVLFLLTGQPGQVDSVVTVSRPPQPAEACRVELSALHERCDAQGKELEELRARPPAISPAALGFAVLSGLVDRKGMKVEQNRSRSSEDGELLSERYTALAASTWTVVALEVSNTGTEPWEPAWAELTPVAGGEPLRARSVLSRQAPLPPGSSVSVAVEVEMPVRAQKGWLKEWHILRLCDAAATRCLSGLRVKL